MLNVRDLVQSKLDKDQPGRVVSIYGMITQEL